VKLSDSLKSALPLLLLLSTVGCHRTRIAAPVSSTAPETTPPILPADSIALISVTGSQGTLQSGRPQQFILHLQYTLASYDSALLSASLDQFSDPSSCVPHGGETSDTIHTPNRPADAIRIVRGTHTLDVPITWSGSTAEGLGLSSGAISFQSSLWAPHLNYRFLTRSFGTQFCQRFESAPIPDASIKSPQ
jgi:hypothetical protein